jgi:selenocysteine lyase/cysteine desulfurase
MVIDIAYWRQQMQAVCQRWVFLDHAAVAPLPQVAVAAIEEYARSLATNGVAAFKNWFARLDQVRQLAARLVNAPAPEDICFIPNTTWGISLIAEGFPWQPGDNVVTLAEEYPANQYPWLNLAARGVEVRRVRSRGATVDVKDLLQACDVRTRLMTVSSVEFASGLRNDLDTLGQWCRQRGIFFFVDAIQSLGVFPIDVQQTPIDALAADGHKWLLGPEGAGIAYIRRDWVERLHPIGVGAFSVVHPWDFSTIDWRLKPHAGRWEGGAYNFAGLTALGASLQLLLETGIPSISERIIYLTDYLCEQAQRRGWTLFSSRQPAHKSGIVSLIHPHLPAREVVNYCRAHGIVINTRADRIRVSPHVYNTPEEIDRFLDVAEGGSR